MPSKCAHSFYMYVFMFNLHLRIPPEPQDVPVCVVDDINCYDTAQSELSILIQNQTMQATIDPNMKIICDCMPACTSLDYNVEISSARYELNKTLQAYREVYEHQE